LGLVKSGANLDDRMAARKAYRTLVRSKKRQHKLKQAEELCRLRPFNLLETVQGSSKTLAPKGQERVGASFLHIVLCRQPGLAKCFSSQRLSGGIGMHKQAV
jgi:hypothetical protein